MESPVESALQLNKTLEIQRRLQLRMESSVEEKKRSQLIDRQIEEEARRIKRTASILLLGDGDCSQALVTQMKLLMNGFTTDKRREYQAIVRNNLWDIMKAINYLIEKTNIEMDGITKIHARNLSLELINKPDGDANISVMAAEAMQGLCASEQFVKLLDSTDVYIRDTAP
jgi:guanine nucleotide-binding protein subunit alpha